MADAPPTGPGYLVDAVAALDSAGVDQDLLRRFTGAMVDWLVRDPAVGAPPVPSPAEDLAARVVVDAAERALAAGDAAGLLRAVALGVPLAMRVATAPPAG